MIRRARNILTDGTVYGLLLTAAVLSLQRAGVLENLERWCYDQRVRACQFFTPPPTDRLVHLDIDDAVLDSLGAWPWPRATLAELMDEIASTRPRAIAMDILFHDPQEVKYEPRGDGTYRAIDNDAEFAASVKRAGCVVIGMSLPVVPNSAADQSLYERIRAALYSDLERNEKEVVALLVKNGVSERAAEDATSKDFHQARRDAMYARIHDLLRQRPLSIAELKPLLLPGSIGKARSVAFHVLESEYPRAAADLALVRFSRPLPPGLPPLLQIDDELAPIPALARAAASAAFFDYPPEAGGVVRRVPLFIQHGGRVYPHISVALAAMMLNAKLSDFEFSEDAVSIPRADGSRTTLPVYTIHSETLHRNVPMMFDIPYFGSGNWQTMYEKVGGTHLSLNTVWDVCLTRRRIVENSRQADDALRGIYELYDESKLKKFIKQPIPPGDSVTRQALLGQALDEYKDFIKLAEETNPADLKDDADRKTNAQFVAAGRAVRQVLEQYPLLQHQLESQRTVLQQRLADRAVLIGWVATSSVADQVPTSLHAKCPGVVIHGTIFNAIMTGHFWRRAPVWVDGVVIALAGLIATFLASRLSPSRAFVYAILLAGGYAAFNGMVLFDHNSRIVSLAGPLIAIIIVWAGCTLARLLIESWERARITRRFSSYVDPSLVSYVAEHPEEARLEGQVRELTVVFTDLAGFTQLTEQIGEKTVGLLNEFMGMAVPIIRSHKGLVNKFLGDGIMFFFGAPLEVPDHAARAIASVLDLQSGMARLNETFVARGLPTLKVRAGISTGHMVVGDAGYEDASDYTVLGDCVNLGARLESANKLIGSACLITDRTVEMSGDRFLVRPIGKICVVGRQAGTMTYEAIARADAATPEQLKLAALTREVVDCYLAGGVDECLAAIERMEQALGQSRLTALYREQCALSRELLAKGQVFDCQIVLSEK